MGVSSGDARRQRASPFRLALLIGATLWIILVPQDVLAHAGVVRTDPADGAHLEVAPTAFEITFSEPIGVDPDGVRLVATSGVAVDLPTPAQADGTVVRQVLPPLADGWYLASWSVVSTDGHVVHGAIAFAVGDATGPPPTTSATDPATLFLTGTRGVVDLAPLAACGAVGAWTILRSTSRRVPRLAVGAATVGAAASLGIATLTWLAAGQAAATGPAFWAGLGRGLLLIGVAVAVHIGAARVALVLASGALATMMFGGHPNTSALTAALLLTHLVGAALWLGAAPAVLLTIRDRALTDVDALTVVRRFSRLATVTLFLAVGGGSLLAIALLDGTLEGVDVRYLGILLTKVSIVVLVAGLGAATRRRLGRGTVTRGGLHRLFATDALLFVAVVALSAGLTLGPPREAEAGADGIHVGHCTIPTETGIVNLSLVPGRVGANDIYLDGVGDLAAAELQMRVPGDAGAIEIELDRAGETWTGGGSVPIAGTWEVTTILRPDRFSQQEGRCELRIEP